MLTETQIFEQALARDKDSILARLKKYTKINETTGCHLWTGSTARKYGVIRLTLVPHTATLVYVHRLNCYLANLVSYNHILHVLHKCDVPACCNPEHLFQGTGKDNMQDCHSKGRMHKDGKHVTAILTPEQVTFIREMWVTKKYTQKEIAIKFNVTRTCIRDILQRKSWKHLNKASA